jgi:hypothetical protein
MSASFTLTRLLLVLDSHVLYNETAMIERAFPHWIFLSMAGNTPGEHLLQVLVQMRGELVPGYPNLRGFRFEVKSSHQFTVGENQPIRIEVVTWEKGGPTLPLEQRPAVRYIQRLGTPSQPPPASSAAAPADSSSRPVPPSDLQAPAP